MSPDRLFALTVGLCAVYVCAMALHIGIHASVKVDLLKNISDEGRARRAEPVLKAGARLNRVCVTGFLATTLLAMFRFPERLAELLQTREWIFVVVALVFVAGPLFEALVGKAARRRMARWNEGENP